MAGDGTNRLTHSSHVLLMRRLTAGAAQPAGWGDGFFGGDGGDDEGFAAASGQATAGDQAPEVVGGSESGSGLFGQEAGGLGGLYGALGVGSNPKPVVKAAPKRK